MPPPRQSAAIPFVLAVALHRIEQRHQHARAAGADGMAEGDGAAMHIHRRRIEAQFAIHGQCLHAEGLVQFEEVHLVKRPAGFRGTLRTASMGARLNHSGSRPLVAWARMTAIGFRPSSLARSALVTTTAAAPSLTPGALPAVTVPPSLKAA